MRVMLVGTVILLSIMLVWLEAAVVAVWGHMDFSQGEDLPWPRAVPDDWPSKPYNIMYCDSRGLKGEGYSGYGPDSSDLDVNPTLYRLVEIRVGWPIQTFQFERTLVLPDARGTIGWMMDEPTSIWMGGLEIPYWVPKPYEPVTEAPSIRQLPIRPMWIGKLSASAVHAAFLLAVVCAPRWAIHAVRRTKGLCVRCGYDRRDLSVCPECGDSLQKHL